MRITVLADQHGTLPDLPPCDLLILAGDLTNGNPTGPRDDSDEYWRDWLFGPFAEWLGRQKFDKAVAIAGNHDTALERWPELPEGITYLCDSGCEYRGLRIWGTPWIKPFGDLAFNLPLEESWAKRQAIPPDTDILISHGPPFGIGDISGGRNCGCVSLRARIQEIEPELVLCGHIHDSAGRYECGKSLIVNAALNPVTLERF